MMNPLLILLLLIDLRLLVTSRLNSAIRWAGAQGFLLGLLALNNAGLHAGPGALVLIALTIGLKGLVFPWLLLRSLRASGGRREVEPYVSANLSLFLGLILLGISYWLGDRLSLPGIPVGSPLVAASFFSILTGFLLIIARKKAIMQVLGFLVLENGIYLFGTGLARHTPLFVELAVLLDLLVAVFVMGITLFQINQEFDHMDTDQFHSLQE